MPHPILGHSSNALVIVECGPRSKLCRWLDRCPLLPAIIPILRVVFSPGGVEIKSIPTNLHILIVRESPTVVF